MYRAGLSFAILKVCQPELPSLTFRLHIPKFSGPKAESRTVANLPQLYPNGQTDYPLHPPNQHFRSLSKPVTAQ